MQHFSVLDRELAIHRNILLEASAGTGKTFSIEHLVVRYLIEPRGSGDDAPLTLDQILLVTFTRAATRELKQRIRSNIERAIHLLKKGGDSGDDDGGNDGDNEIPDYLTACIKHGKASDSIQLLEEALFTFSEAQITTIHAFCYRMLSDYQLEGDLGFGAIEVDNGIFPSYILRIVKDFFRTEMHPNRVSPAQMHIALQEHGGDADKLALAIGRELLKGPEIAPSDDFSVLFDAFCESMTRLQSDVDAEKTEKTLEAFCRLAPSYKKTCNRSGEVFPELLAMVEHLAELLSRDTWTHADFDQLIMNGLKPIALVDDTNRKARAKISESTGQFDQLREHLLPIIEKTRSYPRIFSCIGHYCQKVFRRVLTEEERGSPDELLLMMQKAVGRTDFADKIRKRYSAVIVDEFQDTDPIQWEIFLELFIACAWPGYLVLVGDPKQSIYAFRNADVYTYLSAQNALGAEARAFLDVNYRSQPPLLQALNTLFSPENSRALFTLPRTDKQLPYRHVEAPKQKTSRSGGSLCFFIAEGAQKRSRSWPTPELESEQFFPFIAREIQRLYQSEGIAYSRCAVLVRDRFQGQRLAAFLEKWGVNASLRRSRSLLESPAFPALQEIVRAVLRPRDLSAIKIALGGPIIGWNHQQILDCEQSSHFEKVLEEIYALHQLFFERGFAPFFQELMAMQWQWTGNRSIAENLVSHEAGLNFYRELHHLAEILIEHQGQTRCSPEALETYLRDLDNIDSTENASLKVRQDGSQEAVNILTMHISKGLEFDVVFGLGLVNRTPRRDVLVRIPNKATERLAACHEESPEAQKFYREIDAEKMRQLYVAMTRARDYLYVPVAMQTDLKQKTELPLGTASPMELFLEQLEPDISSLCGDTISIVHLAQESFSLTKDATLAPPIISPIPRVAVHSTRRFIQSFTSLASPTHHSKPPLPPPQDPHTPDKTPHTIPSGKETGVIVHQIFENLDFHRLEKTPDVVADTLKGTSLEGWEEALVELVDNTMAAEIQTPEGHCFCLRDIDPYLMRREMEFLYPSSEHGGFLKGFIDLIFEHENKLYLLDWKTNWLGPSQEDYGRENLMKSLTEHDYSLQARLYATTLKRFVEGIQRVPFETRFGGALYFFVRGISNDQTGVFLFTPQEILCR